MTRPINKPLDSRTLIDLRASLALEEWLTAFRRCPNDPVARLSDIAAVLDYARQAAIHATLSYPEHEELEEAFEAVAELITDARAKAREAEVDAGRVDLGRGKAA